ncbi:translation initiation factor IF-2 [Oceanococcus atlanticus]|uniref:Translation initiation factor IF-2 n=1 Tax=Oceanococcus atlanticus TaxID=1317117 RepID=A0A1Y1SCQ7_9GAMM|nr:translation initiation factor IF-2 [Oceanococcus atlanticus]ORE86439.1 translation initiation factor IF-2 [Oceanococcus atlanticus]
MAVTTVRELAEQTKMPVERLLAQLGDAGVNVADADAPISADEKKQWLEHLQGKPKKGSLGLGGSKKISLKRKEQTELKVAGARGARAKTINVEVRKKRTIVRPEADEPLEEVIESVETEEDVVEVTAAEPVAEAAPEPEAKADTVEEVVAEAPPAAEVEPEPEVEVAPEPELEPEVEVAPEPEPEPEPEPAAEPEPKAEPEPVEAPVAEAPAAEAPSKPEPAAAASGERDSAEPEHLRTEISDLRRRVLENLRRAQEQEGDLARSREEREKAEREAREKEARKKTRRKGKTEQLHVAENKRGKRRKKGATGGRGAVKVDTQHGFERPTAPVIRDVEIPDSITVGDLAQRMAVKASELIKILMGMGMMSTINESLDQDTAQLVVEEMGHKAIPVGAKDEEENLLKEVREVDVDALDSESRPPVVTIMGHVDHGKTTLLDYIRKARVAAGEAGGITQHIGAYQVQADSGLVTFLDTPGHAAFTAMRARGAAVTDIVILVVAADDGVMPQTEEAVQHARAGNVPIVVAITKSDKENADPDRVKNELAKLELIPEDWGGDTQFIPVSGMTGQGVDELLEALVLQSEILELKAPKTGPAAGVVIESSLERGRGPVATVLVRTGTLHKGDVVLAGQHFGRVRAMFDEDGKPVKEAGPSCPVQVLGLSGTPEAGDDAIAVTDERKAKELASVREAKARDARAKARDRRLGDWASSMGDDKRELPVLLKCDVRGSAEALADALVKMSNDEVEIKVVANGVGGISESDVDLATASKAMIIGFNTRADGVARRKAQEAGLELRYYSVIYDVINDVRDAASGLLGTDTAEKIVGVAAVRSVFRSSAFGAVAGCLVEEGTVRRGLPIRVLRDNVVIYEGELESLRRHKDDVNKVEAGTECGIAVKNYDDVRENDRIEVYERVEVQRTLEAAD